MSRKRTQLIIFSCILIPAGACLYELVEQARAAARCTLCKSHIFQVGFAQHCYLDAFGEFPHDVVDDDGVPLLSWRVRILPYLGRQELFDEFHLDEPWDSKHNISLLPRMPPYFQCIDCSPEQKTGFCTNFFHVEHNPVYKKERATELLMIECCHSDIPWTKPGDPAVTEQSFVVNSPGHSVSSNHRDGSAWVCQLDCRCRRVKSGENATETSIP